MAPGEDDTDKPYEPSRKKLDDARRRGEFARSPDLVSASAYLGLLIVALSAGRWSLAEVAERLARFLTPGGLTSAPVEPRAHLATLPADLVGPAGLWLVAPALCAAIALTVQRGWVFAPGKTAPRLDRISPVSNARQKFGVHGLFEFAKSAAKLFVYCVALGALLAIRLPDMIAPVQYPPGAAVIALLDLTVEAVAVICAIAVGIGGLDYLWQIAHHLKTQRMSRKEMTDEQKESEGDPFLKAERRRRGDAIATNRMLAEVPTADVVLTNPTHYAVALKWSRAAGSAPVVVAKGTNEIAARIRERAAETGVPLRRDPATARAIHAAVDIGQEILPEHYRAVAAAIRFAEAMRDRARRR